MITSRFLLVTFSYGFFYHFGMQMTPDSCSPWQYQRAKLLLGAHYGWHLITESQPNTGAVYSEKRILSSNLLAVTFKLKASDKAARPRRSTGGRAIATFQGQSFGLQVKPVGVSHFGYKCKPSQTCSHVELACFWRFALNRNNIQWMFCAWEAKKKPH